MLAYSCFLPGTPSFSDKGMSTVERLGMWELLEGRQDYQSPI